MANKLSASFCRTVTSKGKYTDGIGLYLQVNAKGQKYWRGAYRFDGKQKTASYGVYPDVSLKEARVRHHAFRAKLAQGIDPNAVTQAEKKEQRISQRALFSTLAWQWFDDTKRIKQWGDKHSKKTKGQLNKHILPILGNTDIRELTATPAIELVQAIDKQGINSTAHDCWNIIQRIFIHSVKAEIREFSPVAHITDILATEESTPFKHCTDPERIGEILLTLARAPTKLPAVKAYIQLAPMLFTRPVELRTMRWNELDIKQKLWIKPAETMKKNNKTYLIPLPTQALAIIEDMRLYTGRFDYVLTNTDTGKPISEGAAQRLKIRQGLHDEITWHGWRHTASTLLNEQEYNRDHIELQLSHVDQNQIRGTYNHAQYLDQRRVMLQAWADYLEGLLLQALRKEQ